jgi:hypothetical protein
LENKKFLSLSIIILAMSVVFGSIWIGHSFPKVITTQTSKEKALLTETESAEYLNITIDEFKNILLNDSQTKSQLTSYAPYRFIPYIEINTATKMFNKTELDKWINHNMLNKY